MNTFTVDLSLDYKKMGLSKPERKPTMKGYILDEDAIEYSYSQTRPAVVVCPGGGYSMTSPREGEPIALSFLNNGCHAFVVDYSCAPTGWPAACCEISKAIAYIREHAEEYNIDKDKIIVCGFSAGGHAAASVGVHYDKAVVKEFAGIKGDENKPNGMILGYPVITDELEKTHMGTYNNFCLGQENAKDFFGLEHFVNENTPKTFLWHTFEDNAVPVENSMRFASALVENKVQCELHIFPKGGHGLSLADKRVTPNSSSYPEEVRCWIDMACKWVDNL